MAERRIVGSNEPEDLCPLDAETLTLEKCLKCPYFRGGAGIGKVASVLCNWPRNGSDIDTRPRVVRVLPEIPEYMRDAFSDILDT